MVVHPQGGIEKALVVGHETEGYASRSGHEQPEFGPLGSAYVGSPVRAELLTSTVADRTVGRCAGTAVAVATTGTPQTPVRTTARLLGLVMMVPLPGLGPVVSTVSPAGAGTA